MCTSKYKICTNLMSPIILLLFLAVVLSCWLASANSSTPNTSDSITPGNTTNGTLQLGPFYISRNSSLGDVFTGSSLILSFVTFFIAWGLNEKQKRKEHIKEHADKIRSSAGMALAKLEYGKKLNLFFFDSIQTLIEETDRQLMSTRDFDKVDSFLLEGFYRIHAECCQKIVDEQFESYYNYLYGYPPIISSLSDTIRQFDYIDWLGHLVFYRLAGNDIKIIKKHYENDTTDIKPFELAYRLRKTTAMFRHLYNSLMSEIISPFDKQIGNLIAERDDKKIYAGDEICNDTNGN